jgi:hypothetical protein
LKIGGNEKMTTEQSKEAVAWAIEFAIADQEHYLIEGDFAVDYGAEWPGIAAMRAERFSRLALVCRQMGDERLADSCTALCARFLEAER